MQKITVNGRRAVYYGGVYFYFPENSKNIRIAAFDKCNILTINLNHDIIETTLMYSTATPYTEQEYQAKYGKFDESSGLYFGTDLYESRARNPGQGVPHPARLESVVCEEVSD
jgi:hypothetical protein